MAEQEQHTPRRTLVAALQAPVCGASLLVFRVLFGALVFIAALRYFAHGWIAEYFLVPRHFFPHFNLSLLRPLPGVGMYLVYGALALASLCVMLGLFYRVAAVTLFVLFTYAHLLDRTNYLNHYYLVSLLALHVAFLPLHRVGSIDAWRRPALRAKALPSLYLWTLRFQIGLVYFFGGVAKLKPDWLGKALPLRLWLSASTDVPLLGPLFDRDVTAYLMSWAGAGFDLATPFLLLCRRTRPFSYAAVLLFHLITGRLFQLGLFPYIMSLLTLLFFPPDWPLRVPGLRRLVGGLLKAAPDPGRRPSRAAVLLFGAYAVVQLLVPLRHLLYPGNVLWHEQGFRFAFHVMLMEKNGACDFFVVDRRTGVRAPIDARRYLTPYQIKMMSSQPDLILAFSHILCEEARARGVDPQVHVDAFASLNGRPPVRLIDSAADLCKERDGLLPYRFVLPAPVESRRLHGYHGGRDTMDGRSTPRPPARSLRSGRVTSSMTWGHFRRSR